MVFRVSHLAYRFYKPNSAVDKELEWILSSFAGIEEIQIIAGLYKP
jgi:hypothetical protein